MRAGMAPCACTCLHICCTTHFCVVSEARWGQRAQGDLLWPEAVGQLSLGTLRSKWHGSCTYIRLSPHDIEPPIGHCGALLWASGVGTLKLNVLPTDGAEPPVQTLKYIASLNPRAGHHQRDMYVCRDRTMCMYMLAYMLHHTHLCGKRDEMGSTSPERPTVARGSGPTISEHTAIKMVCTWCDPGTYTHHVDDGQLSDLDIKHSYKSAQVALPCRWVIR